MAGFWRRWRIRRAAIAAYTVVPPGTAIATVELKINYLEAVPGGTVKAEARVLRAGRNFVVAECELIDRAGAIGGEGVDDVWRGERAFVMSRAGMSVAKGGRFRFRRSSLQKANAGLKPGVYSKAS